ncbi:hypothetical protein BSR29_06945 [Boudabousia liubingyangii]|uniref:EamA domain-containing protein n=1 Tax=Boudabousia liubingyangii TaxID=1921764 RepID=A0A1Q5PK07_9ACTO|nr:DMT family transporter [Boudabousia liubingyangii]OKL46560.1 hypothetical protein BSR29_06945 [Boudabousia liubingyangii]OKL46855.1 hypothetical protein BSR28_05345 [Boudabousia liubingyangii]
MPGRQTSHKKHWSIANNEKQARLVASLSILMLCAVWGSTFPMAKGLMERIPGMDYLSWRFNLAFVLGLLLFFPRIKRMTGREWFYGLALGTIYAAGQLFNTIGLLYIQASVSSFITVMYIVFTPLLVWLLFRVRVAFADWIAVVLAITGLAFLSLSGGQINFGIGEGLTLLGALAYALHIVMMGRWAPRGDVIGMSVVQMGMMGLIFTTITIPDGIVVPTETWDWVALFFMAAIAGLGAMVVQGWAQTIISATTVALMFSMEPVFASLFAILFWGEPLTSSLIWGGLLIILAMQVSALGPRFTERNEALVEEETILPETSAGLSQAFEDIVTGGLPGAILEGEDLLDPEGVASEGLHRSFEGGPTEGRS